MEAICIFLDPEELPPPLDEPGPPDFGSEKHF